MTPDDIITVIEKIFWAYTRRISRSNSDGTPRQKGRVDYEKGGRQTSDGSET